MKILIIEDDVDISQSLMTALEGEGYALDIATNGERGSFLARTNPYDLIILDYMLPKKDGATVCKEIRDSGQMTPILMLSAISSTAKKVAVLNHGADDYMTKPFAFSELLARVRALLRRPTIVESPILTVGDLELDSVRHKVKRGIREAYLTRKEFSLLEFLMKHKGQVVSRGMIMEHVWNADTDPFSNTVEAHILNIRKKIDHGSNKKLIHTITGRGYKIDDAKQK